MPQKTSPFIESKYGWDVGEGGWNVGMDENITKFSFLLTGVVDGVVSTLPTAINGQSWFLTTDNRLYYAVGTLYFSSPTPIWHKFTEKSSGVEWQFNGTALVQVESTATLSADIIAIENTLSTLGSAAFESVDFFATQSGLDLSEATQQAYVDNFTANLGSSAGAGLVGYSATVGSPSRLLSDRLKELVSVKDFGAVGNGVADDTAAIQAAIDSGLPLFLPVGTYKVTSTLTKGSSGFYLIGAGTKSVILHSGDYGDTLRISDPLNTSVVTDIVLRDFQIAQDTSVQVTTGTQLKIEAARNFWISGVQIRNGFRGFDVVGADQGHVDGLYVLFDNSNGGLNTGRTYVGILPTSNTGKGSHSGDVFFTNCNFRGGSVAYAENGFQMTAGDGIWLCNSHVGSCTLNTVHVNANNTTKCTGLLIDNCWIDFGLGSNGISFDGSTPSLNGNHYIRNCKILGGGVGVHGIDLDGAAYNVRFSDNEVSDFQNHGVFIRSTFTGSFSLIDNVIRDCSSSGSGLANGITYVGDAAATIQGNRISGTNHAQHINIQGSKTLALINNNMLVGPSVSASKMSDLLGTTISQSNNFGYNPTGNKSVTVGASPWTYTNTNGFPVEVIVGGGTVSAVSKNGTSLTGVTSGTFTIGGGETLTITYSAAPTVRVFGL